MGLEVLSDLSEIIPYPITDFPLYAGIGRLRYFNQYNVGSHWHHDFEFNLVLEGSMDYFVNGENIHLSQGDGIFVNSKRLHYNYSKAKADCRYLVITISPELFPIDNPVMKNFFDGKTKDECSDFILLKKDISQDILSLYPQIYDEINKSSPNLFYLLSLSFSICSGVSPLIRTDNISDDNSEKWIILNYMTDFIHNSYRENITLSDIAKAGNVCRSKCCQLFTKYMGQSPIDYLIFYRLKKAREMLLATKCPVVEVALNCGFNGQSYFTQMFKRYFGKTPKEYRKCNE